MKIRVFMNMDDAVFRVAVNTEDWSEGDLDLMDQFGEPEVNVGGLLDYSHDGEGGSVELGDEFVRVLHGFPYARLFDSRDYGSTGKAEAVGKAWKDMVLSRIESVVEDLRAMRNPLPTEEVHEI